VSRKVFRQRIEIDEGSENILFSNIALLEQAQNIRANESVKIFV